MSGVSIFGIRRALPGEGGGFRSELGKLRGLVSVKTRTLAYLKALSITLCPSSLTPGSVIVQYGVHAGAYRPYLKGLVECAC